MQTVPREAAHSACPPLFATRQGFRRDLKPEPNGESHGKQPQTSFKPRIYVACLAAYNSGYLHGTWIDAAQEPWGIYDEVKAILAASPIAGAEECAIHDYEDFDGVRIEEYSGFERVSAIADFIDEHGDLPAIPLLGDPVIIDVPAWEGQIKSVISTGYRGNKPFYKIRATNDDALPDAGPAPFNLADTGTKPRIDPVLKPAKPPLYTVILVNDDFTPREFVVRLLKAEFRVPDAQASVIMMTAHTKGSCVVAVFTRLSPLAAI